MNKLNQEEIHKLYVLEGLSVPEIARQYGCSLGALYKQMRKYDIPRRDSALSNRLRFEASPLSFSQKETLSSEELLLKNAALMLYWAEGSKRAKGTVDFVNSDPEMVKLFIKCLREVYRVTETKFRVLVYCHANQPVEHLIDYWHSITGIAKDQFTKPYVRYGTLMKYHTMPYGLVHIRYSDQRLYNLVLQEIREVINSCRVGGVDNHG